MAQKLVYVDDISGEEGAREFTFAVEGVTFEIDLGEQNIKNFYEAVAPFVGQARRVGARGVRIPDQLREIMGTQTTVVAPAADDPDLGPHSKEDVRDCKDWLSRIGITPPAARIPVDMWRAWRSNDPGLLKPGRLPKEKAGES